MENSVTDNQRSGFHSQFGARFGQLASSVSLTVRRRMYQKFSEAFPNPSSVLDVGVTSESVAPEANFFEEMFPHKERITAIGIEDAFHLEKKYPGLKFLKVELGQKLPFADKEFDVVFSNAVIEHIVNEKERLEFLQELKRVGKKVFITTPNKYFPVEHHTGLPLVHFLSPQLFYSILEKRKGPKFYNESNLKPIGNTELEKLAQSLRCRFQIIPVRFCGFISNWILIFE